MRLRVVSPDSTAVAAGLSEECFLLISSFLFSRALDGNIFNSWSRCFDRLW